MKQVTTSTIIALSVVGLSFILLLLTLCGIAKCSVETQTQIVSICSMVITSVLSYYFGASHSKKELTKTDTETINQTTITNE